MASMSTDTAGRRLIQFTIGDKNRQTIRLGRMPLRDAEWIKRMVEALAGALESRLPLDPQVSEWVGQISERLAVKLAKVGLMPGRKPRATSAASTVEGFIDGYIAMRNDVKPNTLRTWRQTRGLLIEHFGKGRAIASVTALEARGLNAWLSSVKVQKTGERRFGAASVSKYMSFARQFLSAAVHARLLIANPFTGIKLAKRSNKARQRFIDRPTIDRVLAGTADLEFRLVVALSRYGGLRVPSELDGLLWQHIDRERGRILITSPKTERYEGGESREIPLFPELIPFIDAWYEACPEKCEHVIVSNRFGDAAWRTRMGKLQRKLGIPAWPRVFHNLRASRQTELEESFPSHVVCGWMGNSEAVAREHYLQTTDAHFAKASGALQKALQQSSAAGRRPAQREKRNQRKTRENPESAPPCAELRESAEPSIGSGWESNYRRFPAENARFFPRRCKIVCKSRPLSCG